MSDHGLLEAGDPRLWRDVGGDGRRRLIHDLFELDHLEWTRYEPLDPIHPSARDASLFRGSSTAALADDPDLAASVPIWIEEMQRADMAVRSIGRTSPEALLEALSLRYGIDRDGAGRTHREMIDLGCGNPASRVYKGLILLRTHVFWRTCLCLRCWSWGIVACGAPAGAARYIASVVDALGVVA